MRPRFFNQNMDANEPEKNIPSTAAKATRRSANVADPLESLVSLALDARDCLDSIEQMFALSGVSINEEGIRFRVNVFHHYLKAVEAPGLGGLEHATGKQ
jgi:hypothetical protein